MSKNTPSKFISQFFFGVALIALCANIASAGSYIPQTFVYQLQNIRLQQLLKTKFDLAVIDWDDSGFSRSQIAQLQKQNKKIITYLSIGEAEDYRDYWEKSWAANPPAFLDKENPRWEGNYKVKYWYPEWQKIMLDKIKPIQDAGYDGVYLDIVDAYEYFEDKGVETARQDMISFVSKISETAKSLHPNFLIIPQNAAELIEDESYLNAIDGLGKESTWYVINKKRTPAALNNELYYLRKAKSAGKFVLTIDYPTNKTKQCDFIRKAQKEGFAAFVSNRELDRIKISNCK